MPSIPAGFSCTIASMHTEENRHQPASNSPPDDAGTWNRELAEGWVDQSLEAHGIERLGPLGSIQITPWSAIARCTSSSGDLYFKACEERSRYEVGLLELLAERHADCSPTILALDRKHGWLLMKDAGQRLRDQLDEGNWLAHWKRILARYAELQVDFTQLQPELLQLEVPDRRLPLLAERVEAILDEPGLVLTEEPGSLTKPQMGELIDLMPLIRSRCSELEAAGIPHSINHGDFHDANIFVRGGDYIFLDWGDASLTHPFFSLRTVFVSLENTLGFPENAPVFTSLRDSYLENFSEYAAETQLIDAFDLASRLWPISSLLSWHHSLSARPIENQVKYRDVIPSLLLELLEANRD